MLKLSINHFRLTSIELNYKSALPRYFKSPGEMFCILIVCTIIKYLYDKLVIRNNVFFIVEQNLGLYIPLRVRDHLFLECKSTQVFVFVASFLYPVTTWTLSGIPIKSIPRWLGVPRNCNKNFYFTCVECS